MSDMVFKNFTIKNCVFIESTIFDGVKFIRFEMIKVKEIIKNIFVKHQNNLVKFSCKLV